MKSRCLLSAVNRLPTIDEIQEGVSEDRYLDHTWEEYLDSIRELSQPSCYPLHGPLRGHRRLTRSPSPQLSVNPSDVSFTLKERSSWDPPGPFKHRLLDILVSSTLFAGLTWTRLMVLRNRNCPTCPPTHSPPDRPPNKRLHLKTFLWHKEEPEIILFCVCFKGFIVCSCFKDGINYLFLSSWKV